MNNYKSFNMKWIQGPDAAERRKAKIIFRVILAAIILAWLAFG